MYRTPVVIGLISGGLFPDDDRRRSILSRLTSHGVFFFTIYLLQNAEFAAEFVVLISREIRRNAGVDKLPDYLRSDFP